VIHNRREAYVIRHAAAWTDHIYRKIALLLLRPETVFGLDTFQVNLADWKLVLSDKNPCIWVKAEDLANANPARLIDRLQDVARQKGWQEDTVIVFLDGQAPELEKTIPRYLPTFVVLDKPAQARIHASDSPTGETLDYLLGQISRSRLAPYESHKPVVAGQFFGREAEINKILNHPKTNFLIIGIRRIGKTSLMKEVQRRWEENDKPEPGQIRRLYIDCSVFESADDFFEAVTSRLDPYEMKMLLRRASQSMRYRSQMFERFYNLHGGMVTFLVDEIDRLLLKLKDSQAFFDVLRVAWRAEYARFIMAGFRRPLNEVFNEGSPLFNMVDTIQLSKLPHREVYRMVTLPMERLRITIHNKEGVVNRIFQETAGLPNYIQFYCNTLLEQLDQKNSTVISEEDLAAVYEDVEFRDFILETFNANTTASEKALVYVLILEGGDPLSKKSFGMRELDGFLKKNKLILRLDELERSCKNLVIAGVFNEVGQHYEFALPLLPTMLRSARDIKFMYEKVREEILAGKMSN
jgi:hypothetical protein